MFNSRPRAMILPREALETPVMPESSTTPPVPAPPEADPATSPRRWPRRLFFGGFLFLVAVFLLANVVIWFPVEGAVTGIGALPVLVAESSGMALVLMAIAWFAFFSRLSGLVRGGILAAILLPLIGVFASIRDVEFTADMVATPVFRWQKLQTQVVDEDRQKEAATPAAAITVPAVTSEDMPGYRGVNRDGIIAGPPIRENWSDAPPKELWKRPVGEGYSQFAVLGNLLTTLEQRAKGESVVCYAADSGRELWIHQTPALFDEAQGGAGPRSTPQIDGDRVYTLGAMGDLACLQIADGKPVWTRNILDATGIVNSMWGMTSSPLIDGDQLIVNIGSPVGHGLLSFDKSTGAPKWQTTGKNVSPSAPDTGITTVPTSTDSAPPPKTPAPTTAAGGDEHGQGAAGQALSGYCSPMIAEVGGVRQILNFDGTGLYGHDLQDGHVLWEFPFQNPPGINVAQPIVLKDGTIFITSSYGLGSMRLRVEKKEGSGEWNVTPEWKRPSTDLKAKMASAILYEGFVYGLDEGILVCINPETGKRTWKGGRYGHGQLLLTDGKLIVLSEKGELVVVHPNPKKHEEVAKFAALPSDVKTWNPPAISRGILYIRNHHWMAAYDVRAMQ